MTPTDPGSAGELHVAITGDISALVSALDQATTDAQKAGEEIAAGLSEGAKAAGDSFEEFAQKMHDGLSSSSQFSEAAQEIIDRQGQLQHEFMTSAQALVELQDAYANGTVSALDVARAQEEVAAAMERAVPKTHEVAESAHEAESAFEGLGEHLIKIAEVLGIGIGLEELGREALAAYSHVQDLTTAFTLMTHSAETAAEQVETLKAMAINLAVPFEQLSSMAQRLSLDLGSFDKATVALRDAADAAALSGRSFDSVAQSIDRMALGGTAGARQLVALGISTQTLGEAMDVTADKAAKAFKALDVGDRLEVLHTAMAKVSGGAEAMAQNLSGQWKIFRNEVEFTVEEVGKAIAPLASEMIQSFNGVLGAIAPVVGAIGELVASGLADALHEANAAVREFAHSLELLPLGDVADKFHTISAEVERLTGSSLASWLKEAAADAINYVTHLRDFAQVLGILSTAIEYATGKSTGMGAEINKMLDNLKPVAPALKEADDNASHFGASIEGAGHKAAKAKEDFKVLDEAIREMAKTPQTVENALNEMAQGVNLETLKNKLQTLLDKIRDLSGVGTPEIDAFTGALANDIEKLNGFATSGVDAIGKILAAQAKADASASESKLALDALAASYTNQTPILGAHIASLQEVERATKAYNAAVSAAGVPVQALGTSADLATHGIINFDTALKAQTVTLQAVATQVTTTASQVKLAADGFHGYGVSIEESGAKIIDFKNNVEGTGEVVGSFEGAVGIAVERLTDMQSAAHSLNDAMVSLAGEGFHSASVALDELNAKALANMDLWGKVAAAATSAGAAINSAASAGGGGAGGGGGSGTESSGAFGEASPGFGAIRGGVSATAMIAYAGAFPFGVASNITPGETELAMIQAGFINMGNNMFITAQEFATLAKSVGDLRGGFTDLAGNVHHASTAVAEAANTWTTFTKSMDANGNIVTHAITHTADELNNIPWTTLGQNVSAVNDALSGTAGLNSKVSQLGQAVSQATEYYTVGDKSFQDLGKAAIELARVDGISIEQATNQLQAMHDMTQQAIAASDALGKMGAAVSAVANQTNAKSGSTTSGGAAFTPYSATPTKPRPAGEWYWDGFSWVSASPANQGTSLDNNQVYLQRFGQTMAGQDDYGGVRFNNFDYSSMGPSLPPSAAPKVANTQPGSAAWNPTQQGVQIYVTGNAITSQDSAYRLAQTMVGALRNNAGLKLG